MISPIGEQAAAQSVRSNIVLLPYDQQCSSLETKRYASAAKTKASHAASVRRLQRGWSSPTVNGGAA